MEVSEFILEEAKVKGWFDVLLKIAMTQSKVKIDFVFFRVARFLS